MVLITDLAIMVWLLAGCFATEWHEDLMNPGFNFEVPATMAIPPVEPSISDEPTTTEKVPVKRYEVMKVEFHRVETPFIIGLWIFCASLSKIGFHMAPRLSHMFPESCLLIVVGVVIGLLLFMTSSQFHVSPLTPDTFFLYMLPPIILDAGYFMPNRLFFDHLGTILMFAVIGTIFNTLTIGGSLWAVGQTGVYGFEAPLLDMLLFSALISAVDPVAVLAVFEEIHVNEILYIVVFGESLLNDAVTVVLYHMFEAYTEMGPSNLMYTDILSGFASFFVVALGGTFIGIIWGFLTGFVTRFTNQVRVIEPIFIFVMAYLAYLNAEIFHMSGILAITFCGITMKNYVEANISHKSHTTVKYAMKMLSSSSETIIFMFLGVATVNDAHDWNTWFVVCTIAFCSFYRTIGVIILTAVVNRFRLYKLNKVDKFVMSYGGLRGAVAFALVLLINPKTVKLQPMFVTTTIAVIYFTVFFQGITIKPLVRILNVKRAEKRKPTMNERIHERFMDHTMAGIEDILGHHGNHHLRDRFKRFDNRFIRPYLLRNHQGKEPKILETYSKLAMKDAMDYMRRNASTIGNISGTESMSAIFRNYTAGNLNGRSVEAPVNIFNYLRQQSRKLTTDDFAYENFSQLDSSTWNIDLQELEYNPSKKDLTDAKIHHLLAEELCQPCRRHRRLSYSRHAVDDRDLTTQVNYRMHMNIRRMVGDQRKHHHKRSKRLNKDGKQNHVSFPGIQQNGTAKQFANDYIDEVLHESEKAEARKSGSGIKEDWESGITFTVHPSPPEKQLNMLAVSGQHKVTQYTVPQPRPTSLHLPDIPTAAEVSLPWRRDAKHGLSQLRRWHEHISWWFICSQNEGGQTAGAGSPVKKVLRDSNVVEIPRVSTPTALETMLPWKRTDEADMNTVPLKQSEFPAWCSNREYMAYSSPSATFLGGIEQPGAASVIGLFCKDSEPPSPTPSPPSTVLLIEEATALLSPRSKMAARRGSLLELGSSVDPIQEEEYLTVSGVSGEGSTPSLTDRWTLPRPVTSKRPHRTHSLPLTPSIESLESSSQSEAEE